MGPAARASARALAASLDDSRPHSLLHPLGHLAHLTPRPCVERVCVRNGAVVVVVRNQTQNACRPFGRSNDDDRNHRYNRYIPIRTKPDFSTPRLLLASHLLQSELQRLINAHRGTGNYESIPTGTVKIDWLHQLKIS